MTHRPDQFEAGRQLLELQLAMMKGAMMFMAGSAQRFAQLGLVPAAPQESQRTRQTATAQPHATVPPARQRRGNAPAAPAAAPSGRLAAAGRDYALRVQEDVDSILHAFAMVPDTADRLIRASALLTEKPGQEAAPPARRRAKVMSPRRTTRRDAGEHAR